MAKTRRGKSAEQVRLQIREGTLSAIRQRYARFGDDIVRYLAEKSHEIGGLRRVLSKVLNPLPLEDERMHEALTRFLATEGVEAFFARVDPPQPDAPPKPEPDPPPTASDIAEAMSYRPKYISHTRDEDSWRFRAAVHPGAIGSSGPQAPPSPHEQTMPAARPRFDPDQPWDGTERRSGMERRSGLDRRSGRERRSRVDVVFKNKRFGPNRRTGIERRSGRDRRSRPSSADR